MIIIIIISSSSLYLLSVLVLVLLLTLINLPYTFQLVICRVHVRTLLKTEVCIMRLQGNDKQH